jgi:hypothetical protein
MEVDPDNQEFARNIMDQIEKARLANHSVEITADLSKVPLENVPKVIDSLTGLLATLSEHDRNRGYTGFALSVRHDEPGRFICTLTPRPTTWTGKLSWFFAEHAALPWWLVSAILFGLVIYCLFTMR